MTHHANHPDPNAHWWQKWPAEGLAVAWAIILAGMAGVAAVALV
jgi:hypothetical protein